MTMMATMKRSIIKRYFPAAPCCVLAILLYSLLSATASAQVVLLDEVAAVVDDDVVMKSELEDRVASVYERILASGQEAPPEDAIVPRVLEQLILERIQLNTALRAGVKVSDAEINQALERLAAAQQTSVAELVQQAHQQGLSTEALRRQLRNEISISRVQESIVQRRISITDQEIKTFLASEEGRLWSSPDVLLGHILLPLPPGASDEQVADVQQQSRELYQQLEDGADFKQIALTYSGGQNALSGGDLGWRKMSQLPASFDQALQGLEPGQISQPIRSNAGIHLLKLYDRRGGGQQLVQQHFVRHILIKPNEIRTEEDCRQMLLAIREDVINGADFATLAKENSEDIGSALSGGELGWSLPGQFVPQFEQTMNSIPVGEVSEPFRSQFGWHILQVTDRRSEDFSKDIKKRQAMAILRERKFEEELQLWLQQIRAEAFVDIKI